MTKRNKSLTAAIFFVFTLVPFKSALAESQTKDAFPALSAGSQVKIDGSNSLKVVNESLKKPFEQHYQGSQVILSDAGTDAALKDLVDGKVDIAGIGRPLTAEEKAKGLKEVVISRAKIAIITDASNPYKGDMPLDKFASIFKGDVKNWSKTGGVSAPITVVDRPANSDTRNAFKIYPVFKGDLKTGSNAVTVASDKTDDVVKKLGKNGIGYALIDQVKDRKDVKILSMHNVLPSDPRYPFSQPLYYIYKGPNPNPAVKAFLCYANTSTYATESSNHIIVAKEFCDEEVAAAASTTPSAVPETKHDFPWWLLLFAPLLALPFLLGKKTEEPVVAPVPVRRSRMVLTPRDCKDAYAYWEIPNERKEELRARGGEKLVIRLYDVTDNPASTAYQTIEVTSNNPDLHIPIARDNRDYKAEIGYLTNDNNWLPIAESAPVRVPACVPPVVSNPVQTAGYVSASGVAAAAAVAATTIKKKEEPSRIVLVPRSSESAYAYWEVPESLKASLRNEGGKHLTLKIHDSTDLNLDHQTPHATQEYDVSEVDQDKHVPILRSDRDYIAELGYKTDNGRWLSLARSLHVRVPSTLVTPPLDQIDTTTTASKRKRNVAEKASGVVEGLKDKGEDLLGSAGKLTGNLGEKAGGVVEGLKDKGEDLLGSAGKLTGNLGEKAGGVVEGLKDKGEDLLGSAGKLTGNLGEKAGGVVEGLKDKGEDLLGSAGKLTGNLGEKAGGFLGGLKDKGEDLLGSTGDLKENIGDKAGNILGNVFKAGGAAIAGGAAVVGGLGANVEKWAKDKTGSLLSHDRIELIPQDGNQARVNWQISEEEKTALKSHGGEKLILRICRTEGDIVWQSEIKESDHHQTVSVPETGLDYSADIGYLTASGQWLSLAKSAKVNVPKV